MAEATTGRTDRCLNNKTDNLQCEIDVPYGNVLITSADNKPIDQSQRMILTAAGRMKNTGMEVGPNKAGKTVVLKAGQSPCFVEGLRGQPNAWGLPVPLPETHGLWWRMNPSRRLMSRFRRR